MPLKTKMLLYKQLIRPTLTYAFPVWLRIRDSTTKKLAIFERKCLRSLLCLTYNDQCKAEKKTHYEQKIYL